jgi:hypothetical protein
MRDGLLKDNQEETASAKGAVMDEPKLTLTQKVGKHMLEMRAKRLVRLLELNAPDQILANEAVLILRAACQISPELTGTVLAEDLRDHYLFEKKICFGCFDVEATEAGGFCPKCLAELKAEDAELEDDDED